MFNPFLSSVPNSTCVPTPHSPHPTTSQHNAGYGCRVVAQHLTDPPVTSKVDVSDSTKLGFDMQDRGSSRCLTNAERIIVMVACTPAT